MRNEVDHLALEPVRVLELVDHDHAEPEPGRFANVLVVAKQVAGGELEILEVDDRLASLRSGVLDAEALEQLLQQIAIVRRELLERRPLGCLARPLERRGTCALARERREIDESLGGDPPVATRRTPPRSGVVESPTRRPRAPRPQRATRRSFSVLGRSPKSRTRSRPAERASRRRP
jgi:hypothetical protein